MEQGRDRWRQTLQVQGPRAIYMGKFSFCPAEQWLTAPVPKSVASVTWELAEMPAI